MIMFAAGLLLGATIGVSVMMIVRAAAQADAEIDEARNDILQTLQRQRRREWVEQQKTRPEAALGRGEGQAAGKESPPSPPGLTPR
jgi:hypothetical protein